MFQFSRRIFVAFGLAFMCVFFSLLSHPLCMEGEGGWDLAEFLGEGVRLGL